MSKKVRIGVISDTHIPDRAEKIPQKILDDFKNVDMVIHAGDLVTQAALQQLKDVCQNIHAVCGNMDPYELRKSLPQKDIIEIGKHRIGVTHGIGAPNNLIEHMKKTFKDDAVDVIIFGHSHNPLNETIDGVLFFNPGSATDKLFSPFNSYGIIEITDDKIEAKIIKI